MKILVLSDTHIPRAAGDLPRAIYDAIADVDLVLHAGDFVEIELWEKLKKMKELVAVHGNMDSKELRDILKAKEVVSVGAFKIGLIHGYGAPVNLQKVVRSEFGNVDAIVFGHSHAPSTTVDNGILFFNPGSPTDRVFAPYNSYGVLTVTEDGIRGEIVKV